MFKSPCMSLKDILGEDYAKALCASAVYNGYVTMEEAEKIGGIKVFFAGALQ